MFYPHFSWLLHLFYDSSVNCTSSSADFACILYCSIEVQYLGPAFSPLVTQISLIHTAMELFISFAVKYKAICWVWAVIIFIITVTRLDSIHAVLMNLACQLSEQKDFLF